MDEILAGILTTDFWLGFVGVVVATAFISQPIMVTLCRASWCKIPRRLLGPLVAVCVGVLMAWLWAVIGEDGLKVRALLRDGIINGAASSLAYENIIRPWMERRKRDFRADEVTR